LFLTLCFIFVTGKGSSPVILPHCIMGDYTG
jgi:hypothetical protein